MKVDDRELLHLLRKELVALEAGAYRRLETSPWRAGLIFEDSPLCPNRNHNVARKPCANCVLARFIPLRSQSELGACRSIRLTTDGQTLRTLYASGTVEEIEAVVGNWLRRTIYRLEWDVEAKEKFLQPATLSTDTVLPTGDHGQH
ncbi:MAG TPA: hypothetical protein VL382_10405 [Terriglobales bacterium]|nr:hypothetical protein [Terriglobales bacterium]